MACRKQRLTRVEVEKCEFNGQQLRFVTDGPGKAGSRKLARLTFLPLPPALTRNESARNHKLLIREEPNLPGPKLWRSIAGGGGRPL